MDIDIETVLNSNMSDDEIRNWLRGNGSQKPVATSTPPVTPKTEPVTPAITPQAEPTTAEELKTLTPYNFTDIDNYNNYRIARDDILGDASLDKFVVGLDFPKREAIDLKAQKRVAELNKKYGLKSTDSMESYYASLDDAIKKSLMERTNEIGPEKHYEELRNHKYNGLPTMWRNGIIPNVGYILEGLDRYPIDRDIPQPVYDYMNQLEKDNRGKKEKAEKIQAIQNQIQMLQQELATLQAQ